MKAESAKSVGMARTVLATAIALVLSSPLHAAEPAGTTGSTPAERMVGSEVKPADNSARNADVATGNKVTPMDQSHSESDVELTRSIRKMLVDDANLGTNAQNVKVIAVDGKVTLRGPVASPEELARVVAIANKAAGPDRVLNELEVIKR